MDCRLMSIESMMPSSHLILCHPLLFLPSIFPSIGVFSNESTLYIKWLKYWSFSFSTSPPSEYSGLISFRLTGLISLLSKGISRVFSSTTVQKHEFFGAQPSLWTNSHIYTWLLEKPWLWPYRPIGLFWWLSGKESVCQFRRHMSGRSSGEGNYSPLQYSCLGNTMNRGTWLATIHGVAKQSDKTEWLNNNKTITLTYSMILGWGE